MEEINQEKINQIVAMLDQFVENGGGHMNVTVNEGSLESEETKTTLSVDCGNQQTACQVPTLHQGVDDDNE